MQEKTNTTYNPKEIEEKYYRFWEESGYFEINGNEKIQKANKNFCIMLPPPNVTGSLHIGHALNHTLIDIIVRYKRMQGFKTLWQPGLDHAGIATQKCCRKTTFSTRNQKRRNWKRSIYTKSMGLERTKWRNDSKANEKAW